MAPSSLSTSIRQAARVSVPWATRSITAAEGRDYLAAAGNLTFSPASWSVPQPVSATILGDNDFLEGDEAFAFDLIATGSGAAEGAPAPGASSCVVTIVNSLVGGGGGQLLKA
jgi:hypothetical protein